MRHQRCQWHAKPDFIFIRQLADGLKKNEKKPLFDRLNKIPALRLDAAALEMIQPSDVDKVKEPSEKNSTILSETYRNA